MPVVADSLMGLAVHTDRERRLRARIDALLEQRARKERRILELESQIRVDALPEHERIAVLEGRIKRLNRRLIDLSEQLRAERAT